MKHIVKNNNHGSLVRGITTFEIEWHDSVMEITHMNPFQHR